MREERSERGGKTTGEILYTDDAGVIKYDSCCDVDGNEEEDDGEEDWD